MVLLLESVVNEMIQPSTQGDEERHLFRSSANHDQGYLQLNGKSVLIPGMARPG